MRQPVEGCARDSILCLMAQARLVGTSIEGLKSTLNELRYLDRTLYNEINKAIKEPLKQKVADPVAEQFPSNSDVLSRWVVREGKTTSKSRTGGQRLPAYDSAAARKGVGVVIGGRKKTDVMTGDTTYPIAKIRQKDAGGSVYDMAGADNPSSRFVQNLQNKSNKTASREMWRGVENRYPIIEGEIRSILDDAEEIVSDRLSARGGYSEYQASSARASAQSRNASTGRFGV